MLPTGTVPRYSFGTRKETEMTKGDLRSVWLVPMSGGLGVQVNRRDRKPHFWRVRDMTDASFFRLQRTLDAMDALVRFDRKPARRKPQG